MAENFVPTEELRHIKTYKSTKHGGGHHHKKKERKKSNINDKRPTLVGNK
jgi:hypothetical protein